MPGIFRRRIVVGYRCTCHHRFLCYFPQRSLKMRPLEQELGRRCKYVCYDLRREP